MKDLFQAEGLADFARLKELEEVKWLDEDQGYELDQLKTKYDLHPPLKLWYNRPFTKKEHEEYVAQMRIAKLWAEEIVFTFKANQVMSRLINAESKRD